MITEQLFQFIWQYSLFESHNLETTAGEKIIVQFAGRLNTNAGPDFEEAKVRVGDTLLVGNVELHLKTSDWYKHQHQNNKAYETIILHVVLENDLPEENNNHIPLLVLKQHIPEHIFKNYEILQHTLGAIPCKAHLTQISSISKEAWLSRLLAERWEMKFAEWDDLLQQNAGDWRVLLYWRLAANFGFKTNAAPFLALAQSLPVNILARHHQNLFQIEALLFGQAGMLAQNFVEEYPFKLKLEYQYLSQKYKLKPLSMHLWKFMRMRPANFPTIRIAQFASLIHQSLHLFSQIVSNASLKELETLFEVSASDYWDNHFRFDEEQKGASAKNIGAESVQNIIINTIAPIRFMFSSRSGLGDHCETSVQLLENLAPEKNKITAEWASLNWMPKDAAQSQALIQLFNHYCTEKKCLSCSIGNSIMRLRP
jgi:5-hydroxyisourate hydrolase-like protein (transthyretin family)